MLNAYLTAVQNILQAPPANNSLYPSTSLISYINTARGQLAGEADCIYAQATIATVVGQNQYSFPNLTAINVTGVQGVIKMESLLYGVGTGYKWVTPRSWPWFTLYNTNNPVPQSGPPLTWAQLGQGVNGTFFVDPFPDLPYNLIATVTCYPIPLVNDSTPEAIPYLWTDAVSYYAAYLAYLSAQSPARQQDATRMFQLYETFVDRARRASTPAAGRTMYRQTIDPAQIAKVGSGQRQQQPANGGG